MPPRKRVQSDEVSENTDGESLLSDPADDYTIVPEMFMRMPDDVLSIAMSTYHAGLDAGKSEEIAITNGVISAKNWAAANGKPYRKG